MSYGAMIDWLDAKKEEERERGEPTFMGIPDRWYEAHLFRCERGHVSSMILKTETRGDRCLACHGRVKMTFPEDYEADPPTPIGEP